MDPIKMNQTDNRNEVVDDKQAAMGLKSLVDYTKSRAMLTSDGDDTDTTRRLAVGKSKSVGHVDLYSRRGNSRLVMPASLSRIRSDLKQSYKATTCQSKIDSRTVKSDTALVSPTKPKLTGTSSTQAPKRSPTSIFDFDAQPAAPQRACSEKKLGIHSISSRDRSVLQQFTGFDDSQTLNMSGSFAEDDMIDESSFANYDLSSIPTSFRLSTSNISVPSDLTGSARTLDMLHTSPTRQASKSSKTYVLATLGEHPGPADKTCNTADVIPLPPRRQNSSRSSLENLSKPVVPSQINCFPMDTSPNKPSRQTSVRRLTALQGDRASSFITSLSIDSSPTKPKRQNSEGSQLAASYRSTDSSPSKPERKESLRFLFTPTTKTLGPTRARSSIEGETPRNPSSVPQKRQISRSESMAQPRLPVLSRRDSITEDTIEDKQAPAPRHGSNVNRGAIVGKHEGTA
jgi:hypothetical protein